MFLSLAVLAGIDARTYTRLSSALDYDAAASAEVEEVSLLRGLLGPSGAGRSRALRRLAALGAPASGRAPSRRRLARMLEQARTRLAESQRRAQVSADRARGVDAAANLAAYALLALTLAAAVRESRRRRRAEEEHERLFALTEDLLCICGLDGRVKELNPAWTRTLGWELEELRGRFLSDLIHPQDREAADARRRGVLAGEKPPRFQNRWRRKDGSYRWLQWDLTVCRDRSRVYGVAVDVTQAKDEERRRGEFIAMLTHELQTPVASISAALETVSRQAELLDAKDLRMLFGIAYRNSRRLGRLVGDFMDLQRFEYGRVEFSPEAVELGGLVAEAVEAHRPLAARARVKFALTEAGAELWVFADRARLMQVLGNLISNAVKACSPSGSVAIGLSREGGGRARLRLRQRSGHPGGDQALHLREVHPQGRRPQGGRHGPGPAHHAHHRAAQRRDYRLLHGDGRWNDLPLRAAGKGP